MRTSSRFIAVLLIAIGLFVPLRVKAKCVTEENKPVLDLSRKLIGADSKPIGKAHIIVVDNKGNILVTADSGGDGLYQIVGLGAGRYRVVVKASGFIDHNYTLVVSERTSSAISELRLRPSSECHDMFVVPDDER